MRMVVAACALQFTAINMLPPSCIRSGCSHDCLHGICAAHWAALRAAVDLSGGVSGCETVVRHIGADLNSISTHFPALGEHAPFIAMLGEVVTQLVPFQDEVSLTAECPGFIFVLALVAACVQPQSVLHPAPEARL